MRQASILLLFLLLLAGASFLLIRSVFYKSPSETKKVLSSKTASPSQVSKSEPVRTKKPITLSKKSYIIALYGDSMIDTMAEYMIYLEDALKTKYPDTHFTLYNYGIGGENVEKGLSRVESSFSNRERVYPPLSSIGADAIVVGSFAYNPFNPHDRNKHYALLGELIQKTQSYSSQVYLLAEIAPLGARFGKGPGGVNWPEDMAKYKALHVVEQLEDVVNLSKAESIPLIDAFHTSQKDPPFGDPTFVNENDGIHPSEEGHYFIAHLIAKTIKLK